MVATQQSGWTYLAVLATVSIIALVVWVLGKLFPKQTHTAAGNALLRAEVFFNPSREKVIEAKQFEEKEDDSGGEPPESKS